MIAFLLKRLFWMAATLLAVFTVTFAMIHLLPGGPFAAERKVLPAIQRNLERRHGLDQPLVTQYVRELARVVRGDLGPSYRIEDMSVNEIIAQGFPISAALGLNAMIFAVILGTTAGIISAASRYSRADLALMAFAMIGISMPNFILASLAVILFVFLLPLFPAAGWGSLEQLVLPSICLGAPYAAYIARLTRSGMLEVLGQDFIRTARSKGLDEMSVVLRHTLKLGLVPTISYLGPAIAGILTGSLVVERFFALPGMGSHFVEAALQKDYSLATGVVLIYTLLLLTMNLLVDLSYALLDPRVTLE